MGCDIRGVCEIRQPDGLWGSIDLRVDWLRMRSYRTFAWLADVRNSYGIVPFAEPRGLPKDASYESREYVKTRYDIHSISWISLEEFLALDPEQPITSRAHVPLSYYKPGSIPDAWDYHVDDSITQEQADAILSGKAPRPKGPTYVEVQWDEPLKDVCMRLFEVVLPSMAEEAEKLGLSPSDMRLVFWFDN